MKSALQLHEFAEKEITIQAPWGKLAALTWGDASSPPVLLVHGRLDVCSSFRPLVALLPRAFYYVSLELPGNGKSDHFPDKARYNTVEYVPAVLAVKEHFHWNTFIFIGHSVGAVIGKYFNFAYPGVIRRMVELDPVASYFVWPPEDFGVWYHVYYGNYYRAEQYNSSVDDAPAYTYEKALEMVANMRGITEKAVEHVLERALIPVGGGLYRFSFDRRQKDLAGGLPLSLEYVKKLYTMPTTPTLCILPRTTIQAGLYRFAPFAMDEAMWPHRNYTVKVVDGEHNEHINNPQCMAEDISRFLLDDYRAKL